MKNKHTAIITILVFVLLVQPVCATSTNNAQSPSIYTRTAQFTDISNTTTLTPSSYAQMLSAASSLDEGDYLQSICELFISTYFASWRSSEYRCTIFQTTRHNPDKSIAYFDSYAHYIREIRKLTDYSAISDNISFNDFSAYIDDNTCNAQVSVAYRYQISGAFTETCALNCTFFFVLTKNGNTWEITSVHTSMPNEQTADFKYQPFDSIAVARNVATPTVSTISTAEDPTAEDRLLLPNALSWNATTYNVSDAINYATRYYRNTNSLFGASSANCQNFASQCVWAGLLDGVNASGSSKTAIPAISTSYAGSNASNVWCRYQDTTYYSNLGYPNNNNWTWDNVNGFLRLIKTSNYSAAGPQGQYVLGLSKASSGDVIAWDTTGTRNLDSGTYNHAMFVTKVTGTFGSRGVNNIFIAANTSPTTSAYMPLAEYCSYSASCFATARIIEGYYLIDPSSSIDSNTPTPNME